MSIQMEIGYAPYHCSCVSYITSDNMIIIIGVIIAVVVLIIVVVVVVVIIRRRRQPNINKPAAAGHGPSFGHVTRMTMNPDNQSRRQLSETGDDQSEIEMSVHGGRYSKNLPEDPAFPSKDAAQYSRQLPGNHPKFPSHEYAHYNRQLPDGVGDTHVWLNRPSSIAESCL